jgi:hypothetical protein
MTNQACYFDDAIAALDEMVWCAQNEGGRWFLHRYNKYWVVVPDGHRYFKKRKPYAEMGV